MCSNQIVPFTFVCLIANTNGVGAVLQPACHKLCTAHFLMFCLILIDLTSSNLTEVLSFVGALENGILADFRSFALKLLKRMPSVNEKQALVVFSANFTVVDLWQQRRVSKDFDIFRVFLSVKIWSGIRNTYCACRLWTTSATARSPERSRFAPREE